MEGAFAYGNHDGWGGRDGDELKTVSYINGDAGKNADVDPNSSCYRPDDRGNKVGQGVGATFQSRGTG